MAMHVSLSGPRAWVGVSFGVTHKCCLGSSIGALPTEDRLAIAIELVLCVMTVLVLFVVVLVI